MKVGGKMNIGSLSKFFGSLGAVVSTMGCSACFPLLASFGATIGLGFLAQYEGLFISTLLPIFATIALVSALLSWFLHGNHLRGLLSVIGPALVLVLVLMSVISIWDLISPPHKVCKVQAQNKEETN
jgi:mercuric ion transport protein